MRKKLSFLEEILIVAKKYHTLAWVQLHEPNETYFHECFHNISVFLFRSCLDVPYKTMNNRINKVHEKA